MAILSPFFRYGGVIMYVEKSNLRDILELVGYYVILKISTSMSIFAKYTIINV